MDSLKQSDRTVVDSVELVAASRRFFHWELEFPEVFFKLGSDVGLTESTQQLKKLPPEERGFDAIVGNPPYDILSSKELGYDISDFQAFVASKTLYAPSRVGKNNLYKLFICRIFDLLHEDAYMGLITPMAVLGDQQSSDLRKLLTTYGRFTAIEAFPQKDDSSRRVFEDAKLSSAIFIVNRTISESSRQQLFNSRNHPAGEIDQDTPSLQLSGTEILKYDPVNLTIVSCRQEDWAIATRILALPSMQRLADVAVFYQGEINETNEKAAGNVVADPAAGPEIIRASAVCLYVTRDPSQERTGTLFLKQDKYLKNKRPESKAFAFEHDRIVIQNNAPQNNFRRLIASIVPKNHFCFYTVNYVLFQDLTVPHQFMLALLNSKLEQLTQLSFIDR